MKSAWNPARARYGTARRASALLAVLVSVGPIAVATGSTSSHPFSVELQVVNQCTGEATTVALDGKVLVRSSAAGGLHQYAVTSHINGTAVGETSDARFHFNGVERADYDSETPDAELVIFNNVRMQTRGGGAAFLGYDEQTISIDENGEIRDVAHRFDFSCD